jgi:ABC-type glycerol-3-phosphate transport system permease component
MSTRTIVLIFSLFIYVLILISFNRARKKYSGGKIGEVIKIILITVILLFIADYMHVFEGFLSSEIVFTLKTVFKTLAISFLAYGGTKIAGS